MDASHQNDGCQPPTGLLFREKKNPTIKIYINVRIPTMSLGGLLFPIAIDKDKQNEHVRYFCLYNNIMSHTKLRLY